MLNIIFNYFTEAGDGEYVNKQYYHDADGNVMVRHDEFIKIQHGYDLHYERVDSFERMTDLDELSHDLALAEGELNEAIKDIHRIKKMFVNRENKGEVHNGNN